MEITLIIVVLITMIGSFFIVKELKYENPEHEKMCCNCYYYEDWKSKQKGTNKAINEYGHSIILPTRCDHCSRFYPDLWVRGYNNENNN